MSSSVRSPLRPSEFGRESRRRWLMQRGASKPLVATFGFVDIAGFTALTEAHGDEDAVALATRFTELARAALGPNDRLIKTIGDAVLVTSPDPKAALGMIDRLLGRTAREPSFPSLRAGLHHGPALACDDDVFGASVNLAARVAGEAYAGEGLVTKAIADAARDEGIPVVEIGAVGLKNVRGAGPLSSLGFMVGATESAVDPVCQSIVDRRACAGQLLHQNTTYWFCSLACAAAFASNPQWHVGGGAPG